jgi:hypothetical protein
MTATAEGWLVEQRRVPYDRDEELEVMGSVGLPAWAPDLPLGRES